MATCTRRILQTSTIDRLLRRLIKLYVTKEGASPATAYKDAITDILHLYHNETKRRKWGPTEDYIFNTTELSTNASQEFIDEKEHEEYIKVSNINRKELPLHINDKFYFEDNRTYFSRRLKGDVF